MSKGGRPGLPASQKQLQGTFRADRVRSGIDYELITEIPKPETWLTTGGKKYFRNFCALFIHHKLLSVGNVQEVAIMSEAWDKYIESCKKLKKEGTVITTSKGFKMMNPLVTVRNQALKDFRERAAMFGMDPVSNQKISKHVRQDDDPFDELLRKYDQG